MFLICIFGFEFECLILLVTTRLHSVFSIQEFVILICAFIFVKKKQLLCFRGCNKIVLPDLSKIVSPEVYLWFRTKKMLIFNFC